MPTADETDALTPDGDPVGFIAQLVRRCPGWDVPDLAVRELAGGVTNRNMLVTGGGRRAVARLPGARTELLGIDRANEAEAAARAAALGIGPAIVTTLPVVGTSLIEYVDGFHLDGDAFVERLDDVVRVLRTFHQGPPLQASFPVHRVVERHARDASAHGVEPPALFERLQAASRRIEDSMRRSATPLAPCHNDLLPGNVLFERGRPEDGAARVLLLDYEYAGMNDPAFDLGNLSVNCGLGGDGDESLLRAYYGTIRTRDWARLHLMKVMSEFREGMWAVVQQAISDLDTDFSAYADERLANCAALVAGSEFDSWLERAAG
ncbi:MAG: phosphotransferase [Ilumatobacteraceae bacterium]